MHKKMSRHLWVDIILRLALWFIFIYYDHRDPFVREIKQNEIWKYQYTVTPSYVPASLLWFIVFFTPLVVILESYFLQHRKEEAISFGFGVSLAYGINGSITSIIKILVGRPRPDFYYRCFPSGQGEDYFHCTGIKKSYMDGRKSFPSGHSSFAFTCMSFLTLYLIDRFELFNKEKRGQSWQLCLCIVPLMVAAAIAISRTCDYHHHYEDVIAGSILGTVISYLCYKQYLPLRTEFV